MNEYTRRKLASICVTYGIIKLELEDFVIRKSLSLETTEKSTGEQKDQLHKS